MAGYRVTGPKPSNRVKETTTRQQVPICPDPFMSSFRKNRDYVEHYLEEGYAVIRGVFGARDIGELAEAFDRVYRRAIAHRTSFRHQNVFFQIAQDPKLERVVRFAQWPSYFDDILHRYRIDPRMLAVIEPLIGDNVKQIINQLHWKPPGAEKAEFGYHQDIRFRHPRDAYRNPATSFVQTAMAIDPHHADNGGICIYPGSHKLGELRFPESGRIMNRTLNDADLARVGLNPADVVALSLDPGDLALWNLYTVHGSGPNNSTRDRRTYINGYVKAENCDRGEWTFRRGKPCSLGEPALVHYEELHTKPERHYVDD